VESKAERETDGYLSGRRWGEEAKWRRAGGRVWRRLGWMRVWALLYAPIKP
jgi:hypothetical protein